MSKRLSNCDFILRDMIVIDHTVCETKQDVNLKSGKESLYVLRQVSLRDEVQHSIINESRMVLCCK